MIEEVGEPNLGILFDTWHLWDTPDLYKHIAQYAQHILPAIHFNDWREPTRGWTDRALPGEGVMDLPAILGALDAAGWHGWCDLEIISDDGSFQVEYKDSLLKQHSPEEIIRRSRQAFLDAWRTRKRPPEKKGSGAKNVE
jgi:sugar phosphate isomerase/epimerase